MEGLTHRACFSVFEVTAQRKTLRAVFTDRSLAVAWAIERKVQSWHIEAVLLYTN